MSKSKSRKKRPPKRVLALPRWKQGVGQQIVMLEAAPQEPAGAAGVTLTVKNGAILITPPP